MCTALYETREIFNAGRDMNIRCTPFMIFSSIFISTWDLRTLEYHILLTRFGQWMSIWPGTPKFTDQYYGILCKATDQIWSVNLDIPNIEHSIISRKNLHDGNCRNLLTKHGQWFATGFHAKECIYSKITTTEILWDSSHAKNSIGHRNSRE